VLDDARLSRLVERHAEALLGALSNTALPTSERVRGLISSVLGQGEATLAAVAERLKMSVRTVQRKLAEEGQALDALLEGVRRDLALRYLAGPKITVPKSPTCSATPTRARSIVRSSAGPE
jgi:AraC-like DNA-binding protein